MAARRDPIQAIVHFFMTANLDVAKAALATASQIYKTREAQPAPPAPRVSGPAPGGTAPKPRRKRRTRAEMRADADRAAGVVAPNKPVAVAPAATSKPADTTPAPALTTSTAPRRRRATAAPGATAGTAGTAAAVGTGQRPLVPSGDDVAHVPATVSAFPPQGEPGE